MQKKAFIYIVCIFTIPVTLLLIALLLYRNIYSSIENEAKKNEFKKADVIIIFGAAIGYKGRPSSVLKSRISQGFQLYKNKYSDKFILTGGIGWGPPAESVVMKKILTAQGVPEEKLFFETRSKTTREQVNFSISLMKKNKWSSALLVSDPLHMFRLKKYFKNKGVNVYSTPSRKIKLNPNRKNAYIQMEILKLLAHYLFDK